MSTPALEQQPVFSHAEPVLSVADVGETIRYWQETLSFPNQWVWGFPPTHGGVSWHGAHIQFHQDAERAKGCAGSYIWIRVKYVAQLYKIHQQKNANIIQSMQQQPWGMDDYVVKDLNGYNIVFAGHTGDRAKSVSFPDDVDIIERIPTKEEFITLHHSVGWTDSIKMNYIDQHLKAPVLGIVAIDKKTSEVIGCALVISDNASFYYLKDVMVKKEWQGKRVGTAIMKAVSDWLDKNGIKKSTVGLYTGENLEPFYSQFGFNKGFGMVKII